MTTPPASRLLRVTLWRRLDVPGIEHAVLRIGADDIRLEGTALLAHAAQPVRVDYEVVCSPAWETRSAAVTVVDGTATRRLSLVADAGRWRLDGTEIGELRGCVDVDLGVTPATNTLSIRRLSMPVGEGRDVTAAWVRLPELEVEPLPQRYTRAADRRYLYESRGAGRELSTQLEVDDAGLVTSYPPFWERVVSAEAAGGAAAGRDERGRR